MKKFITLLLLLGLMLSTLSYANQQNKAHDIMLSMIANKINHQLETVTKATTALGQTYQMLYKKNLSLTQEKQESMIKKSVKKDGIRALFLFDKPQRMPNFRAPMISSYLLNDNKPTSTQWREIATLRDISPSIITLYKMFNDGWVYITTQNDLMTIYPYVPINEAINNKNPTKTVFYQAANFKRREAGFSKPYVDLVGDGKMVTSSYPIYHKNQLLGASSIDITIAKLMYFISKLKLNKHNHFLLFSHDGNIISPYKTKLNQSLLTDAYNLINQHSKKINHQLVAHQSLCYENMRYEVYATKIKVTNWLLMNILKTNSTCKS